jgi:hypothetical protein
MFGGIPAQYADGIISSRYYFLIINVLSRNCHWNTKEGGGFMMFVFIQSPVNHSLILIASDISSAEECQSRGEFLHP